MDIFSGKKIKNIFQGMVTSPLFYNFLIDLIPIFNLSKKELQKIVKYKIEKVSDSEKISFVRSYFLWLAMEKLYGKSTFGLEVANHFSLKSAGILGELFLNSKNLKEAVSIMNRYLSIIVGSVTMKYYEVDEFAIFSFELSPRFLIPFSIIECFAKVCHNWVCQYLNIKTLPVKEIHYSYKKPNHYSFYTKNFYFSEIYFDDSENYIVLNKEIFYLENKNYSTLSTDYVLKHADKMTQNILQKNDFKCKVRNQILLHISKGVCSIDSIAKNLNLSTSTLKRRLKDENTTFKTILNDTRKLLSESMVKDTALSLEDIAYLLGYSEYSPFFRAFKKWFSRTPSEYRKLLNFRT